MPASQEIESEFLLITPSELQIFCKSMLGIDVTMTIKEEDIQNIEKDIPETLISIIKDNMIKKAGGQEQVPFSGESDPWCNIVRSLSFEAIGTTSKLNFTSFPNAVTFFKNIQSLNLTNHPFSTLPNTIGNLAKLQELTVQRSKIKSMSELANCSALLRLNINDNKLTAISKSIQNLKQLIKLDVHNNQIKDICTEISSLENLEEFNISNNRISKLNVELNKLTKLQYLNVSNNQLGSGLRNRTPILPISSMNSLTYLDLSYNKLNALPSLDLLEKLKYFNMEGNLLAEFPLLNNSPLLETLNVAENQITNIPLKVFKGIQSLTSLNISNNKFKLLPSSIEILTNLKYLNISNNKISAMPDALGKLPNLTELDISKNDLMVIQNGIFCQLNQLKKLILKNNRISRLPEDFFSMKLIEEIDLNGNTLQDLPKMINNNDSIQLCKTLKSISLVGNQLTTLPDYFSQFQNLEILKINDNPIQCLPDDFCDISSIQIICVFNLMINSQTKTVSIIPSSLLSPEIQKTQKKNKSTTDDDLISMPAIEHLLILARNCPHRIFILALAEFSSNSLYQSVLESHLDIFLYFLSINDIQIAIDSIRALCNLALTVKGRIAMFETPLLLQTLLVLGNRDDSEEKIPLAYQALKAVAHMCLYNKVAELILQQGIQSFIDRESNHENKNIREGCRKILCNVGYKKHLNKRITHLSEKRGVRILCMDGGGTKSVSTVLILQEIEKKTGKKISELFDFICGTSVGGILSCLFGIACLDATQVQALQKRFFKEIFTSGSKGKSEGFAEKFALLSNLFSTGGRYNTPIFEKILREIFGEESLIDSSSRVECAKVFVAAVHMDVYPPDPFLFRNYTYPPGVHSRYPGNCERKVWEGIRATSAAPSMFTECVYGKNKFKK